MKKNNLITNEPLKPIRNNARLASYMNNTNTEESMALSFVVRFLLFITLSAILSSCATSKHMTKKEEQYNPYVIDVDKFDPPDFFEQMKEESAAREKSRITTCYLIGNVDIRFVPAAEGDNEKEDTLAYDSITTRNGQPYYISKATALDRDDIELLCVEKTSYKGNYQYLINVLFKKEAWDKVHNVTESLINKKLAFIKEGTVISAPVIHEAIAESARLFGESKEDTDWFVRGLTPTNQPSADMRNKAYTAWLERRVQNCPDDSQSLTSLARVYTEKKQDCKKTIPTFEKVMRLDPVGYIYPFLNLLDSCYKEAGNYERAITFYSALLDEKKIEPWDDVYLRMALAEAYAAKGTTEKALDELERALAVTKSLSLSFSWLEGSTHKDEIERQLSNNKAQMIKVIEAEIEKIRSQDTKKIDK